MGKHAASPPAGRARSCRAQAVRAAAAAAAARVPHELRYVHVLSRTIMYHIHREEQSQSSKFMAENARLLRRRRPRPSRWLTVGMPITQLHVLRFFVMKKLIASSCERLLGARPGPRCLLAGHSAAHWLAAAGTWHACAGYHAAEQPTSSTSPTTDAARRFTARANGHAEAASLLLSSPPIRVRPTRAATQHSIVRLAWPRQPRGRSRLSRRRTPSFISPWAASAPARRLFRLLEDVAPRACANFLGLCEASAGSRASGRRTVVMGPWRWTASTFYGYRSCTFRLLHGQVLQGGRERRRRRRCRRLNLVRALTTNAPV